VASFDFPESRLLASIYAGALRARGYPARVQLDAGTREVVDPALASGLVDLVPEYAGSSLQFLTLGRARPSADVSRTYRADAAAFARRGLVALRPAPAQDSNVIVMPRATAAEFDVHAISDLSRVASRLVFGGAPECPQRPFCLLGLRRRYGLRFRRFVALDAGGPLTEQALRAGDVDVGLLFSTDPALGDPKLSVLADDRLLQPAENVIPVVRAAVLRQYGPGLARALEAVSARLTTVGLRALDEEMARGGPPGRVASRWLRAQGLA